LLESVPYITVKVVVSAEQQAAAARERDSRDAADDVVMRVHGDLLVRPHVKQSTRRVVRASRERQTARKILQSTVAQTVIDKRSFSHLQQEAQLVLG